VWLDLSEKIPWLCRSSTVIFAGDWVMMTSVLVFGKFYFVELADWLALWEVVIFEPNAVFFVEGILEELVS
jgi:hypothetical protein